MGGQTKGDGDAIGHTETERNPCWKVFKGGSEGEGKVFFRDGGRGEMDVKKKSKQKHRCMGRER